MFTADESGTVTLPLTIPPAACSLTLANHGSGGASLAAAGPGGGLAQPNPLDGATTQQPILPAPFLLPTALPMQPVHQVNSLSKSLKVLHF